MTTCQRKNENRRRVRGKCKMNFFKAYADRLKTASFIRELGGWRSFWWGRVVQTFVPAGGGNGKAIMILNVTPLAIRANAEPHTRRPSRPHAENPDYKYGQTPTQQCWLNENTDVAQVRCTGNSAWNQSDHVYFFKVQQWNVACKNGSIHCK